MFGLFSKPQPERTPEALRLELASANPPVVIDVREPSETAHGHIPGALLIPLGQLPNRMGEIPKEREVVVVCKSGGRSANGTRLLIEAGFNAFNMPGGMSVWQGDLTRP